ncbi:uncharacterized protein LOC131928227 [Physella acuta]|uniref:uncharacterized protein LOC131928227 n=1 Tax=Physella acuta TaxID=109671 RepID=UPI0027DBFE00|nr:uncharacterized protein LOC131928227 [Physella acuta]
MGNTWTSKLNEKCNKLDFYQKVKSKPAGEELITCSFGSWCRRQKNDCGFSDQADYTSNRNCLLHLNGSLKADTMEGRFFRSGFKSRHEVMIYEKETQSCLTIRLPALSSPDMVAYVHSNRIRRRRRNIPSTRVVAYHDGSIIVQVNSARHPSFSKFYVINLELQMCTCYFILYTSISRWFEAYVSPSWTNIVLRPDMRYHFHTNVNYNVQVMKCSSPKQQMISVHKSANFLPHHSLTYNSQLGDDHIIAAKHRSIQIYVTETWSATEQHILPIANASIQQIRSSPSGEYIAVRYTYPADGCCFNRILILHYPQFSHVIQVDVRGAYWPVSELVNMQVFPRFSLSELCFAVMKQHNYGRKVFVYKLPIQHRSLKDICRRAILHLVNAKDIPLLPIPLSLKYYLAHLSV